MKSFSQFVFDECVSKDSSEQYVFTKGALSAARWIRENLHAKHVSVSSRETPASYWARHELLVFLDEMLKTEIKDGKI